MQATLSALAGLGFFLSGLHMLAQAVALGTGPRLRALLARLTRGPVSQAFCGVALGTLTQSTSASTFICMGLMHAGALGLGGAMVVTAWAPVGTALLVFLASINLLTAGLVAVGLVGLSQMLKLNRLAWGEQWLRLCFSAGIMLTGLGLLKEGGRPLQDSPWVAEFFVFAADAPLMVLVAGLVLSLVAQSASTVSVLGVALLQVGVLPGPDALWLVVGASLGSGLSVSLSASHLMGWPRLLALWQTGVRLLGALVMLAWMTTWPEGLAWARPMSQPTHSLVPADAAPALASSGLHMALFYAALQGMGALLASTFLPWLLPWMQRSLARENPSPLQARHLYPEATRDPASALALAWREQAAFAAELPRALAARCGEPGRDSPGSQTLSEDERHAAMGRWHAQIQAFVQECLAASPPMAVVAEALRLLAGQDTLQALNEALHGCVQALPAEDTRHSAQALCRELQARLRGALALQSPVGREVTDGASEWAGEPSNAWRTHPIWARALRWSERARDLLDEWQRHHPQIGAAPRGGDE